MAEEWPGIVTRRRFLQGSAAVVVVLAACGEDPNEQQAETEPTGGAPEVKFNEPSSKLSGDLKILLWSHFVPRHDKWFDAFARDWGEKFGVNVTVDHIEVTGIPARIESEISARSGHDVIQFIARLPQFEPSCENLADVTQEAEKRYGDQIDICRKSSLNGTTNKYYAYAPGWVPDPGNYRKSMWEKAGFADGPNSWEDLREGGSKIKSDQVFAWNPASNNQGFVAGKLSYILNSISAYRTLQKVNPGIADDVNFVKALEGPKERFAAQHVMYNWIVPKHAKNVDAAKEFLLHYTENYARATWESELYDFPAFPDRVPELNSWLKDSLDWSTNVGYRGSANTAVGEVFGTFILPNMFARVARGRQTAEQSVEAAERQVVPIFDKWRERGLIGGGPTGPRSRGGREEKA